MSGVAKAGPATSYATTAKALRRRELLEVGVGTLLLERAWADITMADVASAAGVSRQTLYDEFGSRGGLAQAYVLVETDRFLDMVDAALAAQTDAKAAIAAALETFLLAAEAGGLLRAIVTQDGNDELLALITTHGGQVVAAAADRLARFFEQRWPGTNPDRAHLVARSLVRLAVSHATLPDAAPAASAAEVADLFGPYVLDMTASQP